MMSHDNLKLWHAARIIHSCETAEQLDVCRDWVDRVFPLSNDRFQLLSLINARIREFMAKGCES